MCTLAVLVLLTAVMLTAIFIVASDYREDEDDQIRYM